ncbi:hypothetical protein M5689_018345 [Euphorbia peplus]|nr:hypothetical protein M5689_018345 [Euphorbia peplus]
MKIAIYIAVIMIIASAEVGEGFSLTMFSWPWEANAAVKAKADSCMKECNDKCMAFPISKSQSCTSQCNLVCKGMASAATNPNAIAPSPKPSSFDEPTTRRRLLHHY